VGRANGRRKPGVSSRRQVRRALGSLAGRRALHGGRGKNVVPAMRQWTLPSGSSKHSTSRMSDRLAGLMSGRVSWASALAARRAAWVGSGGVAGVVWGTGSRLAGLREPRTIVAAMRRT